MTSKSHSTGWDLAADIYSGSQIAEEIVRYACNPVHGPLSQMC